MTRTQTVAGWGHALQSQSRVLRPQTVTALQDVLSRHDRTREPAGLRGAGQSYGDAALLEGGTLLSSEHLNRFISFDPATGAVEAEPGVTMRELWELAVRHGFWPPVVPGTMRVSLGGAAAMNIHGKNAFQVGTLGEHIEGVDLITPDGALRWCSREQHSDIFHAAIGGFGMLGCFSRIALRLKRIHSGRLRVTALSNTNLEHALQLFETHHRDADYLVGWIDCYARGTALGRGLIHRADHLEKGEDPAGEGMCSPAAQAVPTKLFGMLPKGWVWPELWLAYRMGAWSSINFTKYVAGVREQRRGSYLQTHGAFHFLLDYVPHWKRALLPGGLIQFQPFVPMSKAENVFAHILSRLQKHRLVPYLGVLKRHRADPFLMSHGLDGYSLALDIAVTRSNRRQLWSVCQQLADRVLEEGGRFYYAKDAILAEAQFRANHGELAVKQFQSIKNRMDPYETLQTDLWRRLTGAGPR